MSENNAVSEQVQQENVPGLEQDKVLNPEIDFEMEGEEDLEVQQDILHGKAEGSEK